MRYKVPYLRLFPIWKYGPRYDALDGHYIDDGWFPVQYGEWTYPTLEAAQTAHAAAHGASQKASGAGESA